MKKEIILIIAGVIIGSMIFGIIDSEVKISVLQRNEKLMIQWLNEHIQPAVQAPVPEAPVKKGKR